MTQNRNALSLASGACAALVLLLGACVGPPKIITAVPPMQIAPVLRPAGIPTSTEWHDMPATAGTWHWAREGNVSVARFGLAPDTLLSLTCNPQAGTILLVREGQAGMASTVAIHTTSLSRTLAIRPTTAGMTAALPAHDPLLDAMAFSRGRFAVEIPGLAALYLPSWSEVARVVEDCR